MSWWSQRFGLEHEDDFSFVEKLEAKPITHYLLKARYNKLIELNEYEYETLKQAMDNTAKRVISE